MRPNWIAHILLFIEALIRIVMGICLVVAPLLPINNVLSEPYCDIAYNEGRIPVENPTHIICRVLIFFVRAFGVFNVGYGFLLEIGRRQLQYSNNKTGWFVVVCCLMHLVGLFFELFLQVNPGASNTAVISWHASFAFLYGVCLYYFTN